MAFDPLDCGKNAAQKALDAADEALANAKADLKAAVDLPDTEFGAKLYALKAKATAKLNALNLTIPEIPKIPNFQEELDKIMADFQNPEILSKLDKFKESWKDIIPLEKIETLADKIKNPIMEAVEGVQGLVPKIDIDICKAAPKQDAEVDSTGKLKPKQTPPVGVSPDETVKPDPVEVKPPAAEEVIRVPEEGEEPTGEESKKPTTFTLAQAIQARDAMVHAQNLVLIKIKEAAKEVKKSIVTSGGGPTKKLGDAQKAVPRSFFDNYPESNVYDYYIGDEYQGKVPDIINKIILKYSKLYALADMKKAIKGLNTRIINSLNGLPTKDGKDRWSGGWESRFELELRAALYYDQGFGIREYHPSYGFGLRNVFKRKETADKVRSAFQFKIRDYNATFTPSYQNGDDIKNGGYTGEPDTQFSNLIKDYVTAIYNAKVKVGKNNQYAFLVLISFQQNIDMTELTDFPKEKDFLPTSLGGNLPPYEDYLGGLNTETTSVEGSKFAESTFQPHYMFKKIEERNVILSQLAETYEEHLALTKAGYVHDSKGI